MEQTIHEIAIRKLTEKFDEFVGECMSSNGKPKPPSMKAMYGARGCLPHWCKNTIVKKKI